MQRSVFLPIALLLVCALAACSSEDPQPNLEGVSQTQPDVGTDTDETGDLDTGEDSGVIQHSDERATLVHDFGELEIGAGREFVRCVSWTLNNDKPLYVEKVSLSNNGSYHHSNWFVVPEDVYDGEDGFWRCSERNFEELNAALDGTVLFAQSTQSRVESQYLADGVVIKIPPRHRVVADVHLLNITPRDATTKLRMALDVIHPRQVKTVVTPFRLAYLDLNIPPNSRSRVTGECDLSSAYAGQTGKPLDIKLFWVLPHYHALGDYFGLEVMGGPNDGQKLFELSGFNAEANGQAFNPPVDLTGANGLRFSCGFNNPRDEWVRWGFGDQEMCLMLAFAEADALMDNGVLSGDAAAGEDEDGVKLRSGPCFSIGLAKNRNQGPPEQEEIDGELYVPEGGTTDEDLDPIVTCSNANLIVEAEQPATLESISETIFTPTCTFSACHDQTSPAAGLDLSPGPDLEARLLNHTVLANVSMPLVQPGAPEESWLLQIIAQCEPQDAEGNIVSPMPKGASTLLEDPLIAKVRDWILSLEAR